LGKEYQYIIDELITVNYPPAIHAKAYQIAEGKYCEPDMHKAKKYWIEAATLNYIPAKRKLLKMKLSSKNIFDKICGFLGLIPSTVSFFYFGVRGIEDDRVA
jgi:TPR repeat protein